MKKITITELNKYSLSSKYDSMQLTNIRYDIKAGYAISPCFCLTEYTTKAFHKKFEIRFLNATFYVRQETKLLINGSKLNNGYKCLEAVNDKRVLDFFRETNTHLTYHDGDVRHHRIMSEHTIIDIISETEPEIFKSS